MKITKSMNEDVLTIALEGRLDTNTSSELENEVQDLSGIKGLVFDLEKLEYISSSGLRILLSCQKKMNVQGSMIVKNASDSIKEIFDITGFSDILTLQ